VPSGLVDVWNNLAALVVWKADFSSEELRMAERKPGRNGISDVEGCDQTRELCGMLQVLQDISGCREVAGKTKTKIASRTQVDKVQQAPWKIA
jgi:hypothetical protein